MDSVKYHEMKGLLPTPPASDGFKVRRENFHMRGNATTSISEQARENRSEEISGIVEPGVGRVANGIPNRVG